MSVSAFPLPVLCGQLVVGGFEGTAPSATFLAALGAGERGGAILFRRNLADLAQSLELTRAIAAASPADLPPFVGVDQEGGRVVRLRPPVLALPPARVFGRVDRPDLTRRAGRVLGLELAALGFNLNFAPVLDVDSNPDNPIIGDRSYGDEPERVVRHALAFAEGLDAAGIIACGKHYPGHGDTALDSHLALPVVGHDRERLERIELAPFLAAARAGLASLMTAHVLYPALDQVPATFSHRIASDLLRQELGFGGVLFSDDLEMGAVAGGGAARGYAIEEAAVEAVAAGCDALLICRHEALQARAHAALVRRAELDGAFRARCEQAAGRGLLARSRLPPRATSVAAVGSAEARALAQEIEREAARTEGGARGG